MTGSLQLWDYIFNLHFPEYDSYLAITKKSFKADSFFYV